MGERADAIAAAARALPRPQGDEVETVARALREFELQPGEYRFPAMAKAVLAALDACSGADTVNLAEVRRLVRDTITSFDGNWDEYELADVVDSALASLASGADTVKRCREWLASAKLPGILASDRRLILAAFDREFASGADRPEGSQT